MVEVGNHQQLMAKGGTYASMWALQREEGEIPDDASADSVEFAPVV